VSRSHKRDLVFQDPNKRETPGVKLQSLLGRVRSVGGGNVKPGANSGTRGRISDKKACSVRRTNKKIEEMKGRVMYSMWLMDLKR